MLALTIMQPWASAIMGLGKDVENRDWAPPEALLGQRFAIHAGKRVDMDAFAAFAGDFGFTREAFDDTRYRAGVLLGTVRLVGYVHRTTGYVHAKDERDKGRLLSALDPISRWRMPALFHWVLSDPVPLDVGVEMRGAQRLWRVP